MGNFRISDDKTGRIIFAEEREPRIERNVRPFGRGGIDEEVPRIKGAVMDYIRYTHTKESER